MYSEDLTIHTPCTTHKILAHGFYFDLCSTFEAELQDVIPVVKASIAGTRVIGRMCVGNKNGLLLPQATTDQGTTFSC